MTVLSALGVLSVIAMIPTAPEAGERASVWVGKDRRAVDNTRLGRIVYGDFDNVDAK